MPSHNVIHYAEVEHLMWRLVTLNTLKDFFRSRPRKIGSSLAILTFSFLVFAALAPLLKWWEGHKTCIKYCHSSVAGLPWHIVVAWCRGDADLSLEGLVSHAVAVTVFLTMCQSYSVTQHWREVMNRTRPASWPRGMEGWVDLELSLEVGCVPRMVQSSGDSHPSK